MHRTRSIVSLLTAAALVAACGSTPPSPASSAAAPASAAATTVPSATPTTAPAPTASSAAPANTPSPSGSAVADAAATFNKALTDPLWTPHITVKAVSTIGQSTIPITGTIDVSIGSSHSVLTFGQGGSASTQETISGGGVKYTKQYGGWFKSTDTSSGGFGKLLTGTSGFTDSGVEAKNGEQLHHMVLPAGTTIPLDALGVPAGATNVQAGLEGWADDEGSPVLIAVSAAWTQNGSAAAVPVTIAMELTVDGPGQAFATPTEDDLWAVKTVSPQHASIAVPTTWQYTKGSAKKYSYFDGYDGSFIAIGRLKAGGFALNKWVSYARTHLATWSGLTSAKLVRASSAKLGGTTARVLEIKGSYKGVKKNQLDIIAVKGGYMYELVLSVPRTLTDADRQMWLTFLATWKYK